MAPVQRKGKVVGGYPSVMPAPSAAADRVHDFDAVALVEHLFTMPAVRNDLAIDLDGDATPGKTGVFQQLADRGRAGTLTGAAIECDLHAGIVTVAHAGAVVRPAYSKLARGPVPCRCGAGVAQW